MDQVRTDPTLRRSDSTVLLEGEIGTGKELVANAVHRRSQRLNRPFATELRGSLDRALGNSAGSAVVTGTRRYCPPEARDKSV